MGNLTEADIDMLLEQRVVDVGEVVAVLKKHHPEYTRDHLERVVMKMAARDGYRCRFGNLGPKVGSL